MKAQKRGPKRITVLYPLSSTTEQKAADDETKKLRVAAYCRVSTNSEEQLLSINNQIQYYEKYINENPGYTLVGIYTDQGISGTDMRKRDAFMKLMEDCIEGAVDRIITKSVSRFGRNTLDALNSIRALRDMGVDVYFEREKIHTMKSEGELLLTLISAVAQNESLVLSGNVKWGIHRKYERGHIQSIPCGKFLGYDKDDRGNLVINEAQAAIVRRIYQEFLDGYGYHTIARRLTEDGVLTERGNKEWSSSVIKKILTNEKIKGDTLFQKTFNADPLTKKRVKNKGELPQYYYEDTHPAIIDKHTWECVQLEFERQEQYKKAHFMSKYHYNQSQKYGFVGKVICKHCSRTYVMRESARTQDPGRQYWRCAGFRAGRYKPLGPNNCQYEIRIDGDIPGRAFIKAWNELVENRVDYEDIDGSDELIRYRVKELRRLVEETGQIEGFSYELMLKTMDHILVGNDSTAEVIFLGGRRVEVRF
ncbi:recombinase family protein [Desulfosporosinus sp. HMP52]|uniref:recombinase family protein n=1 Tax=Desulfosporosinus sp. HMP52 TaxID=1487923 RepID=UPI00068A8725|nr:recombinase family protein [Desulfosporosinus sp. HMP52]